MEWRALELETRYRYLSPESPVAEKVVGLHADYMAARADFTKAHHDDQHRLEEDDPASLKRLSAAQKMLQHTERRCQVAGTIHFDIWSTLRPPDKEASGPVSDEDYADAVLAACLKTRKTIDDDGRLWDLARRDLLELTEELFDIYAEEGPDCLSFDQIIGDIPV